MSKPKRTLSVRVSLPGDLDPDDFSNQVAGIFDEYLDAVLAMDEGDRMTLRDANKTIVGRAEVSSEEEDYKPWMPMPYSSGLFPAASPHEHSAVVPVTPHPHDNLHEHTPAAREDMPASGDDNVAPPKNDGKFGKGEFAATMDEPQKSNDIPANVPEDF